jgi:hypothetical protein
MSGVAATLEMTPSARRAFDRLANDLQRVFGGRFVALVAYGANNSVVFAKTIGAADLDALGALVGTWKQDGLATPLVMTPDEFRRSLDAFPLEYQAILDRHSVIAGVPPFADVTVKVDDLRRACETQARSYLIHIREGWLESAGHNEDLAALIAQSAQPFRALVSSVARLEGEAGLDDHELSTFAERVLGVPATLVRLTFDLESHPEHSAGLVGRMPEYLAAAEQLWTFVDSWRAE